MLRPKKNEQAIEHCVNAYLIGDCSTEEFINEMHNLDIPGEVIANYISMRDCKDY